MNRVAVSYRNKIIASWQSAVDSILTCAEHLKNAESRLKPGDWLELLEELPFSHSTAEKLLNIANCKFLTDASIQKSLPPHWTTIYEISTLSKGDVKVAIQQGAITPWSEREHILKFKSALVDNDILTAIKKVKTDVNRQEEAKLVDIYIPAGFLIESVEDLKRDLGRLEKKYKIGLKYDSSKNGVIALQREHLANQIEQELEERAKSYNVGLSQRKLDIIEDTFSQLRGENTYHQNTDGSYLREDIRNPKHMFHGISKKDMYSYCRKRKIITRWTRQKELDKTGYVLSLILQHSRGESQKRADAKRKLDRLIKRGNKESKKAAIKAMKTLIEVTI